jgi:hypothetical protein
MKESFTKTGYNMEEAYFHRINQELIQKLKEKKNRNGLKLVSSQDAQDEQTPQGEYKSQFKKAA